MAEDKEVLVNIEVEENTVEEVNIEDVVEKEEETENGFPEVNTEVAVEVTAGAEVEAEEEVTDQLLSHLVEKRSLQQINLRDSRKNLTLEEKKKGKSYFYFRYLVFYFITIYTSLFFFLSFF